MGSWSILTPQAMTDPTATAENLRQYAKISGKPVLASWMGGAAVEAGEHILNQVGIPTYAVSRHRGLRFHPDVAVVVQPARALRDASTCLSIAIPPSPRVSGPRRSLPWPAARAGRC